MRDFGRTNTTWFASTADRDAFIPAPRAGQLVGVASDLWKYNGTTWIKVIADLFDPTSVGNDFAGRLTAGMQFEWNAAGGYFSPRPLRGVVLENTGGGTVPNGTKLNMSWHNDLWVSDPGMRFGGNPQIIRLNQIGFWSVEACIGVSITAAVAATSYFSIQVDYPTGTLYRMQKVIPGSTGAQIITVTAVIQVTNPALDCSIACQGAPGGTLYVNSYSPKCSVFYLGSSLVL